MTAPDRVARLAEITKRLATTKGSWDQYREDVYFLIEQLDAARAAEAELIRERDTRDNEDQYWARLNTVIAERDAAREQVRVLRTGLEAMRAKFCGRDFKDTGECRACGMFHDAVEAATTPSGEER